MKVLFLTKYPIEGASSRYRVFQYLPQLEQQGIECTASSFMDSAMYRVAFSPGNTARKAWHYCKAVWRRLRVLSGCNAYDLVFMQREVLPFGPPLCERWLRRQEPALVFDYDDALFVHQPSEFSPLASLLRSRNRVFGIFRNVDCVLAGNDYLAAVAAPHCRDTRTFHVAEDTRRFKRERKPKPGDEIVIGWMGSWSTEKYLETIRNALRQVLDRYPETRLRVVGGLGEFDLQPHEVEHREWQLETETTTLLDFDIGIMPLPLNEWSLGKSGGKARTYMAAGLPVVCTAIGYNLELVDDRETGFLVTTEEEWVQALSQLVEDRDLRRGMGEKAQKMVEKSFSLAGQSRELAAILRDVAARGETQHAQA
jgi:glycosyltransferase involved in cell wall biosynthesis